MYGTPKREKNKNQSVHPKSLNYTLVSSTMTFESTEFFMAFMVFALMINPGATWNSETPASVMTGSLQNFLQEVSKYLNDDEMLVKRNRNSALKNYMRASLSDSNHVLYK